MTFADCSFPRHAFAFKGGAGGAAPPIQAMPAPPPTATSAEVAQAKMDARRQAKTRMGMNQTVLAGTSDTPTAPSPTRGNVLLGGG